ncbi:MAG: SO_0444 family Cu/Zn efflux transporter [Candidatus Sumerlaeia bacterium]|nr:SO_0444 family Cu/Zn efflux transporter [Candidatus Sumerlaeia bacterium]
MTSLFANILAQSWLVLAEAAPYILFGTAMAGVLRALLPADQVPGWLAGRGFGPAFRASLIGLPLPLCSCSVLPVAMELRQRGASRGATGAFLVSTPQTGVDSILLSFVLLNPLFAVVRVIGSFVTALVTGFLQTLADDGSPMAGGAAKPSCCSTTQPVAGQRPPLRQRLLAGQHYAFGDLLPKMAKFYAIGILATGVVMALLPEGFLERYLGGGFVGMLVVAVMGVAVYLCASAATPLAAALVAKGMSPGTALVMLLAGPAASLASMAAVRAMIGTRGLAIYLSSITVCAILVGLALDGLYVALAIPVVVAEMGHRHEHLSLFSYGSALVLLGIFAVPAWWAVRRRWQTHFPPPPVAPKPGAPRIRPEGLE